MRIISRSKGSGMLSSAGSISEPTVPAPASVEESMSQASGNKTSSCKQSKRGIFARHIRSESTPRTVRTTSRLNSRQKRKDANRSQSAPRSAQVDVQKFASISTSSTNSLQLLASLAIDAALPGSAEVTLTPDSKQYDEHGDIRRRLFSQHDDSEVDDEDTMEAPLLGRHQTVDISTLAMTRTATSQSTEVYRVVEQEHPKRVWETLFQQHEDSKLHVAVNHTDCKISQTNDIPEANESNECTVSETRSNDDDIELTMSVVDAHMTRIEREEKESATAIALLKASTEAKPVMEPVSEASKNDRDVTLTLESDPIASKVNAIELISDSDEIELVEEDVMTLTTSPVAHEIKAPRASVMIDRRRRRLSDEPDVQPVGRMRSLADDVGSFPADSSNIISDSELDLRHHISVFVETVDSTGVFHSEEKKEDVSDNDVVDSNDSPFQILIASAPDKVTKIHAPSQAPGASPTAKLEQYVKNAVHQCMQSQAAAKVFRLLSCGDDATTGRETMFYDYDNICNANRTRPAVEERPLYDVTFTLAFLKTMTTDGITVFSLQRPDSLNNPSSDWSGRAVNMVIEPGTSKDARCMEPKLEWTILPGGQRFEVHTTSVPLLSIHAVSSNLEPELAAEIPDKVYFTITTDQEVVHIFEANTPEERDRIVNGLRSVLARLSYHLIAGDSNAALGLYKDDGSLRQEPTDDDLLPWSCRDPGHPMNQMAHVLLG